MSMHIGHHRIYFKSSISLIFDNIQTNAQKNFALNQHDHMQWISSQKLKIQTLVKQYIFIVPSLDKIDLTQESL